MSKYDAVGRHLSAQRSVIVKMTFAELEQIIGSPLPASASKYQAWWANEKVGSHVQAKGWMSAGFEVDQIDLAGRRVTFQKI